MNDAWQGYSAAQAVRTGGRGPIRSALLAARGRTLALAEAFDPRCGASGQMVPYAPHLNPPLWELGHIGWFQEYWIGRNRERARGIACVPEHVRAASILRDSDRWYDSGRVEHRSRWELPLPGAAAARDYLEATLAQTLNLLDALPEHPGDDALYFFRLTALHEQMHAEAAVYMARTLGVELPHAARAVGEPAAVPEGVLHVAAQSFVLGSPAGGFAFDNELGAHQVELGAFEIDAGPVTWARYLPFVQQGGYGQRSWWTDAGWGWLAQRAGAAPGQGAQPKSAAVHLNAHEAQAWCRWAGRRLPTEAQWECAALTRPDFSWGQAWEWTASLFQPYPGFVPHPYRDYSQPWFATRQVLRGACPATAPEMAHPRYRNFFEPHRGDIFAGFRSCA